MKRYKILIRIVAFAAVFCALFLWIQELVTPDYNWPQDSDRFGDGVRGLYKEPQDSLQVYWVGTSHMRCAITPMVVYRESGIRSYNLATNGQTIGLSLARLKLVFRHSAPKVVLFEASACFLDEARNKKDGMWRKMLDSLSWYRFGDKYIVSRDLAALNNEGFSELASGMLPLLRYHTRYLLEEADYTAVNREQLNFMKGYCFRKAQKPVDSIINPDSEPADADGVYEELVSLLDGNRQDLLDIAALCKAHDCKLVLVKIPVNASAEDYHSYWDRQKHDLIARTAEEIGCPFVDLNFEDVGIDWTEDTTDGGHHLNSLGARKVSAFMANWLSQNCGLPDGRDDAAAESWNRQLELYSEEERLYDIMMEEDPNAYLDRLAEGDFTLLVTASKLKKKQIDKALVRKVADLTGTQTKMTSLGKEGLAYLSVSTNGTLLREEVDPEHTLSEDTLPDGTAFIVESDARTGKILLDARKYARIRTGLQIVVYDNRLHMEVDCVTIRFSGGEAELQHHETKGRQALRSALSQYESEAMSGL